jgi:DNA repair exonuclease SbcCD ATPase subunit
MRSVLNFCLILGFTLAVAGCAKPPQLELDAANAALAAAKAAEADVYAPDTFRSASTAMNEANAKVETKDYEGAKASAIQAKETADRAKSEADTNKQQTRDEAQAVINRVSPGLDDARTSLSSAPSGKGADEDLAQLSADLGQAEANLNDARSNLSSGKFKDALAQARSSESKLSQVQGSVQTANQKIEAWKELNKPWFDKL